MGLKDLEIARAARLQPIEAVAERLGLRASELEPYGAHKGKVGLDALARLASRPDGRLILVTAMTPTPAGEGKSTTTIGLADGIGRLGRRAVAALREPSLGPCFGMKGAATGGGRAQVAPMEEINLHFTGDLHAVGAAHNLLAALVDNHLFYGNDHGLDARRILWKRVLDLNDRALRSTVIGLGGPANGVPRESGFEITAASEVMAILTLAADLDDLRARIGRIVVGETAARRYVTAGDLRAAGALTALLKDAIKPNLVQTLEGTPALVHGGPFANIAHGCSSLIATRLALKAAEFVVTEAGFGSDLGAEKFFHIKCRAGGLAPAAAVVVATVRALKMHGGVAKADLARENVAAVQRGLDNLAKHVENVACFGVPAVVALNRFPADTGGELDAARAGCAQIGVPVRLSRVWELGGEGGVALAEAAMEAAESGRARFGVLYPDDCSLSEKIQTVARTMYGADRVDILPAAAAGLARFEARGYGRLPVCMAKTQSSLSDDPHRIGRPRGFEIVVRDVRLSAGAGFIVAYTGDIMTMPGLPDVPNAAAIDVDAEGRIVGLV